MKLIKNNLASRNSADFQSMLAHCRKRLCEIVVELEETEEEHLADPTDEGPLNHILWIEGHLLAAVFPCDFKGAEERSEEEKAAIESA